MDGGRVQSRTYAAKRRRRPAPPTRLEWGFGEVGSSSLIRPISSSISAASDSAGANRLTEAPLTSAVSQNNSMAGTIDSREKLVPSQKKRQKSVRGCEYKSSSALWVEKYAPTDTTALCVLPKKVKEVREWLEQSRDELINARIQSKYVVADDTAGKMLILVGSPGIGKSTLVRVLAAEMGWAIHEWNDTHTGQYSIGNDSLLSLPYQSQLASFDEFLQAAGNGVRALTVTESVGEAQQSIAVTKSQKQKFRSMSGKPFTIVLIEETPNLHSAEAAKKMREITRRHIQQSKVPTVMIFSDVCEGKHRPDHLERLIDPSLLYSPLVKIKQVNPVTKTRMKKCLEGALKAEGLTLLPDHLWEELHSSSGGDLRHSMMALQFQHGSDRKVKRSPRLEGGGERDKKLSTFHALGKLLYAKRRNMENANMKPHANTLPASAEERPPLEFIPEDVMNGSDIDRGGAISFLHSHSPDFFTDESELSRAFGHFSDAALFLDRCVHVSAEVSLGCLLCSDKTE